MLHLPDSPNSLCSSLSLWLTSLPCIFFQNKDLPQSSVTWPTAVAANVTSMQMFVKSLSLPVYLLPISLSASQLSSKIFSGKLIIIR